MPSELVHALGWATGRAQLGAQRRLGFRRYPRRQHHALARPRRYLGAGDPGLGRRCASGSYRPYGGTPVRQHRRRDLCQRRTTAALGSIGRMGWQAAMAAPWPSTRATPTACWPASAKGLVMAEMCRASFTFHTTRAALGPRRLLASPKPRAISTPSTSPLTPRGLLGPLSRISSIAVRIEARVGPAFWRAPADIVAVACAQSNRI